MENYISPIHEKSSRNEITNYRPISLLNYFAKLFDSTIASKILDYIFADLSASQRGYIKVLHYVL